MAVDCIRGELGHLADPPCALVGVRGTNALDVEALRSAFRRVRVFGKMLHVQIRSRDHSASFWQARVSPGKLLEEGEHRFCFFFVATVTLEA